MLIGNKLFDMENNYYIMGILNATPDSFSDGGRYDIKNNNIDVVLKHVDEMIKDGASIIDVGGESTKPGYTMIKGDEEIERVVPVIEAIKREYDVPVSLDTYKSSVAKAGIEAGCDMINDILGLKWDQNMAGVIASSLVPCCLMHNRDNADKPYRDFLNDVISDMRESIDIAVSAGIDKDKIIIDPGIGFAKSLDQNLNIMKNLNLFTRLGYPVLLGTSRKSMIGLTLNLPVNEREIGTAVTTVYGLMNGCRIFRVHDVKSNYQAAQMTMAIMNA